MTLSEQESNQIRAEAEMLYPYNDHPRTAMSDAYAHSNREGYIAAATKYQERIKGLLEALEKISMQKMLPGETDQRYAFNRNWHLAVNALTNYNESLKG